MTSDLRCPRCAAHAPAGAQWCSLCYADLRPSSPVAAQPEQEQPVVPEAPQAPTEPAAPGVRPRGKHARRAPADAATPAVDLDRTAAEMLAQLAASESAGPIGGFSSLVDSPAKKVAVMVGGAVVAMLVLFILMAVVGSLL